MCWLNISVVSWASRESGAPLLACSRALIGHRVRLLQKQFSAGITIASRAEPSAYTRNILASSDVNRLPALPDGRSVHHFCIRRCYGMDEVFSTHGFTPSETDGSHLIERWQLCECFWVCAIADVHVGGCCLVDLRNQVGAVKVVVGWI